MGIINTNRDSFYSVSRVTSATEFVAKVEKMVSEGADMIDIGACSTRPGSEPISLEIERKYLKEALVELKKIFGDNSKSKFRNFISIDTFRADIVKMVYDCIGEFTVNDISAGEDDKEMLKTVAELNLPYIAMHKRGKPSNMQTLTDYPNGILSHIREYFENFKNRADELGIKEWTLDPGFGFAKTIEQNYQLLFSLDKLKEVNNNILVGISRKSLIYKLFDITPEESLPQTMALNLVALTKGATILRVHDIKEGIACKTMYLKMINK